MRDILTSNTLASSTYTIFLRLFRFLFCPQSVVVYIFLRILQIIKKTVYLMFKIIHNQCSLNGLR